MNSPVPRRRLTLSPAGVLAAMLAAAAALSLVSRIPGAEQLTLPQTFLPASLLAAGLWFAMLAPTRVLAAWACTLGLSARFLALASTVAMGGLWLAALPLQPSPDTTAVVTISVLDGHDERAKGREIWLRVERDGTDVPLSEISQHGDWIDKHPFLVAVDPTEAATLQW